MPQIVKKQILRKPQGIVTSAPPENVDAGRLAYLENYEFSEGAHRVRRGFVKKNRYAIPVSGMVFNGTNQYLKIIKDQGDTDWQPGSTANIVISCAFIVSEIPVGTVAGDEFVMFFYGGSGVSEAAYALQLRAVTDGSKGLKLSAGVRAVTDLVEYTLGSAEGDVRPGVGYRIFAIKDTGDGSQHWRMLLFREDTITPLNGFTGTTGNLPNRVNDTDQPTIARSRSTATPSYFPGMIQDVQLWKYSDSGAGSTELRSFWGTSPYSTEDRICVIFDHSLSTYESGQTALKFYARLEESSNLISSFQPNVGGDTIIKMPSRAGWASPGLVDNAPKTACLDLNPDAGHYHIARDLPGSNSLFDQFRLNTYYEAVSSMAFRIDKRTIDNLVSYSAADQYLPLFYYGDNGGDDLGLDISGVGQWVAYVACINAGTTSAPDYRIEVGFVNEDDVRVTRGPTLGTLEYDTKYRVDVIRANRYLFIRVYKDGEQFQTSDTEMYKVDLGAAWEDKQLYDGVFANGACLLYGTMNYAGNQYYFPGQIDDLRVFSRNIENLADEYNIARHVWDKVKPDTSCIYYALLNEGQGRYVADASTYDNSFSATNADFVPDHQELMPFVSWPTHGPGWLRQSQDMRVSGLTGYKDSISQTEQIFAVVGGSIWANSTGEDADDSKRRFQVLLEGLTGSKPMSFTHLNNSLIMADGVNPNFQWDGKSISSLGIPAPTAAPSAVEDPNVGGIQAGTFVVYYSWKNSKTGARGDLSPGTTVTVVATTGVSLRVGYAVPDFGASPLETAGIDTVQIWRTKVGGQLPYLERELKIPTRDASSSASGYTGPAGVVLATELLSAGDGQLGLITVSNLTDGGVPPQARFVVNARGRLFLAGIPGRPNRLAWSKLNFPSMHDPLKQFSDDIDQGNGDEITGMVFEGGSLYIFMRRSIWMMRGIEDEAQMRLDLLYHGIGCVHHATIQVVGGTIIFRGEDNFYALNPGSANPVAVGEDIRNLLEWVAVDLDEYGTSAVLPKEGLYLCALTSQIAQTVGKKNDYIFAFDPRSGAWGTWSVPQLGYLANIELGERSQLYALMRTGFVMKYESLGLPADISYADGLRVDKRSIFTLMGNVEYGATVGLDYIDLWEDDSSVDLDQDSMAGCNVSWVKAIAPTTFATRRIIRKVLPIDGGGIRVYLDAATTSDDLSSAGLEAMVGGYDKRLTTPMLMASPEDDWSSQARMLQISVMGEGCGGFEIPVWPPKLISGSAGTDSYAYTYKSDDGESPRSPRLDGASSADAKLELIAPTTDIGENPVIRVYRLSAFAADRLELVEEIDMSDVAPGLEVVWQDSAAPKSGDYDPQAECAKLVVSSECIYRAESKRADSEITQRLFSMEGPGTWVIPINQFCSRYQLTFFNPLPRAQHTISGIMADIDVEQIDR